MRNDPCAMATQYAAQISRCKDISELEALGREIKENINDVVGWEQWLRDCYFSKLNYDLKLEKKNVDMSDNA